MQLRLYDDDGLHTPLDTILRIIALLVGILCGLSLFATPFLLMGAMMCDAGCHGLQDVIVTALILSPLFLLMATGAGFLAFNRLSRASIVFLVVTAGIPAITLWRPSLR